MDTLYRRALPADLIPFASADGRTLFAEALADSGMHGYFRLAQQFQTQADPAFCSLGSLVVALNALDIDPGRLWRGPWRWFSEELLDCCIPLEHVRENGMTLDEVGCLARCNGADAEVFRPDRHGLEALREQVVRASSADSPVLVVNYDRQTLGQTGGGHYSPLGGYHARTDQVLVLDVARFKYPPHWVALERLWSALVPIDPASGASRGWLSLTASTARLNLGFFVESTAPTWSAMAGDLRVGLASGLTNSPPRDLRDAARIYLRGVLDAGVRVRSQHANTSEHESARADIDAGLADTALWDLAKAVSPAQLEATAAAMLLATAPPQWVEALPKDIALEWMSFVAALPAGAREEASRIAAQLEEMMCACRARSSAGCDR